jgi:hypothetical protein
LELEETSVFRLTEIWVDAFGTEDLVLCGSAEESPSTLVLKVETYYQQVKYITDLHPQENFHEEPFLLSLPKGLHGILYQKGSETLELRQV